MPMKIEMTKRWKTRSNPFSVKYPVAKHNSINTQNSLINSTWYIYVSASNPIYIIKSTQSSITTVGNFNFKHLR